MAFIPWPFGAKAILKWHQGSTIWQNHLAFTKPSFLYDDMIALSGALETGLRSSYRAMMSTSAYFDGVDVVNMEEEGAAMYNTAYAGAAGTSTEDYIPPSLCALVTLRTAKRGRSYRGRVYLGGFVETLLASSLWHSTLTEECVDQMGAWQADALVEGWTLCIASEMHNHVVTSPAEMVPVTSIVIRSSIPAHQRRRDRRP